MDESLSRLQEEAVAFREARDWKQFHKAKDLALGLVAEAGELAEVFLWEPDEVLADIASNDALRTRLGEEMSDVLIYLLYLAEHAGIDLAQAFRKKLAANGEKYPVEKVRGSSTKYTDLT